MSEAYRPLSTAERARFFFARYRGRTRPTDGKAFNQRNCAEFVQQHAGQWTEAQVSKLLKGEIDNPGSRGIGAMALYFGIGDHLLNQLRPWPGDEVVARIVELTLEINEPAGFDELVTRLNFVVRLFADKERPSGGGYTVPELAGHLSHKTGEQWTASEVADLLQGRRHPIRLISAEAFDAIAQFFHATLKLFRRETEYDEAEISHFLELRWRLDGVPVAARQAEHMDLAGLLQVVKELERARAASSLPPAAGPEFLAPRYEGGE
ncbi:hypothetical protein [Amycolatopsis viridis]|uniref:Transcriptional regulator with XRE-family HTH domain n=1 Tax=Amycolatopsis viridis TaxID=185678 RepID=A0ABX0T2P7_9PSEU|nr:hypothetical protein [Amycolatopsis viridis]NIH82184.1 transcriptional regulator with XRE-family HTH domain [Amycolatopsis viridis]